MWVWKKRSENVMKGLKCGMICSLGLGFYGNLDIKSGQEWKMEQTCSLRYACVFGTIIHTLSYKLVSVLR